MKLSPARDGALQLFNLEAKMWRFELTPTLRIYFNILYRKLGVDFFTRTWTNTLPPSRCGF